MLTAAAPFCPHHPEVSLEPKKKGWYCEECDQSVVSYDAVPREGSSSAVQPRAWPGGLDPATLPTWLAHPWAGLCAEQHPRVRLHWLVDTAELVVRWTVALALAEVVAAGEGRLPVAVARWDVWPPLVPTPTPG